MHCFVCKLINVPVAHEKTEGSSTIIEYLGLTIDNANKKRVKLRSIQSLAGSFAFCTRAIPAGRAFIRGFYALMSQVTQPHHYVRVTKTVKCDLLVWLDFFLFFYSFNGISFILDKIWCLSDDIQLYTDSTGWKTNGCGVYFAGKWAMLKWPTDWADTEILKDVTYLELVPIALAICLWGYDFKNKKI